MRKIVLVFIVALLLIFVMPFCSFAALGDINEDACTEPVQPKPLQREEGEIVVVLDGNQIMFDVKPTINNGTTLVPIRAISTALEATVEWDENTKTVTVNKDNTTIKLTIDSITMYVDGNSITLNHPAVIIDGRTLVPVRAISEAFGCLVGWDANTKQISVIADTHNYCMLYTVDGRAKCFHRDLASAQLNVGWYDEPVQTLYAPGKSKVFKKSEVTAQLNVGWYDEPLILLYALGKNKYFPQSKVPAQLEEGWYENPPQPIKICIDAGHYAKNNRSLVYPSYYESVMTWELHLLLKKELESYGFEVITTRSDKNKDLPLEERGEKAKGCDLFISLHSNACEDNSVDGAIVIPFQELSWTDIDDKSRAIGEKLGACIKDVMNLSYYQVYICIDEEDRDENGLLDDEYYSVLHGARNVGTPGVILEHGFHTNAKCAKWLSDNSNLEKLAKAEAKVVADYFGYIKVEK